MQTPDMRIQLNSGGFDPANSQELIKRFRAETGLRVEGDVFDFYSQGTPFPPELILSILYTLFPLRDVYVNIISSMLLDAVKAAHDRTGRGGAQVSFFVRKVDEDGRILKEVRGVTRDPKIIKDLIRRADEPGNLDGYHYFPPMTDEDAEVDDFR